MKTRCAVEFDQNDNKPKIYALPPAEGKRDWGGDWLKNPIEQREACKRLMRFSSHGLSPSEFRVACFIFSRTVLWGKEWEVIPLKHFTEGITDRKTNEVLESPIGMSRPTLRLALRGLQNKGLILLREASNNRAAYSINFDYDNTMIIPKRLQQLQKAESKQNTGGKDSFPPNAAGGKESFPHNYTYSIEADSITTKVETPSRHPATEQVISKEEKTAYLHNCANRAQEIMRRTSLRRQAKKLSLSTEGVTKAWQDCCREAMPQAAHHSVTAVDAAVLKRYLKRAFDKDAKAAIEFLSWVCHQWLLLQDVHFSWMQGKAPLVPSIRFMVKFSEKYEEAYRQRDYYVRLAMMSLREREILKLVNRGMNEAAAAKEVDARLGAVYERDELVKQQRELERARINLANAQAGQARSETKQKFWQSLSELKQSATNNNDIKPWDD